MKQISTRTHLISRLTKAINLREDASLTEEQVDHYIGSDMPNHKLHTWLDETEDGSEPVSVDDVMELWDSTT